MILGTDKIEEIKAVSDIVEVVGDYVQLKKRGSTFIGLCPFHKEKTPSFNVNPNIGIYKCFGCGKGGDVISFLTEMEGFTFVEAVKRLAEKAGIELPEDEPKEVGNNESESIYYALKIAAKYFWDQLTQTEVGKETVLKYFSERGFKKETIQQFGLGYAPNAWDGLLNFATEQSVKQEFLLKAGLVIQKEEKLYDRFRNRAMFPIFSHIGKVVGFGGRILVDTPGQPKYINSPETQVYQKSKVLYGLFQSKQAIRGANEAILVEGYTDVISLHQASIKNVVSSSGTALTTDQINLIKRYANKILLIYDADAAGVAATLRGVDLIFSQGLSTHIVELPNNSDPDSFVKQYGRDAFLKYIETNRMDFIQFSLHHAKRRGRWHAPEDKAQVIQELIGTISKIPDSLVMESYVQQLSFQLQIPEMDIRKSLTRQIRQGVKQKERESKLFRPKEKKSESSLPPSIYGKEPNIAEKTLLRLMLEKGTPMIELVLGKMAETEFTEGAMRTIIQHLVEMYKNDSFQRSAFFDGSLGSEVTSLATEVYTDRYEISDRWDKYVKGSISKLNQDAKEIATDAMCKLKLLHVQNAIEIVRKNIFQAESNQSEIQPLLEQLKQLHLYEKRLKYKKIL